MKTLKKTLVLKRNKTLIILGLMLCIPLLFSFSSATDLTKSTLYSENDLKVTFSNWWGLGAEQGSLTLKSHPSVNYIKKVPKGWQVTMYYDFNFKEQIADGLGDVEFIDMKTGKLINKQWRYVYWHEEFQDRDITETNCIEGKEIIGTKNGTTETICETKVIGTEKVLVESGWRKYNSKTIPLNMRIGIEVYSVAGENIDGIWNLGSKRLDRHAEWSVADCGTGGAVSIDGDFCVHQYKTAGTFQFNTTTALKNVSILVVAGGGAGGNAHAGGGGAGGLIYKTGQNITSGSHNLIVGNGGTRNSSINGRGNSGTNSTFLTLNALGGGGGGAIAGKDGLAGGSGGGGSKSSTEGEGAGGTGLSPQGYAGGASGGTSWVGGGGGGANGTGAGGGANGGNGGTGFTTSINGTSVCYAGGGGGAPASDLTETGGLGTCGGTNGFGGTVGTGVNATLGGGSGGARTGGETKVGKGGDGVVVIRYAVPSRIDIELLTPANNTLTNTPTIMFSVNITDVEAGISNVSLYINGIINQTNSSGVEGVYNFSETLSDGSYNWSIIAYDINNVSYESETRVFRLDATPPTIEINSGNGTQNYGSLTTNHTINFTATDTNLDKVWFNYNGTNTTITGAVSGVMNSTSFPLVLGLYTATIYANDTAGNVQSQVVSWNYKVFENSRSSNSSSFETAFESYPINLTANSSLTAVNLLFNGTAYSMTNSGSGIWTYSRDLPSSTLGNNSINYRFTYAGDTIDSTYLTYQNVSSISLAYCTTGTPYLNLTFKDEVSLVSINSTMLFDVDYYLGTGTQTKNLLYQNTSENPRYSFCFTPITRTIQTSGTIKYSSTGYPLRNFALSQQLTNTTTSRILYLLNGADGIYAQFQAIDSSTGSPIQDVTGTAERLISGEYINVGSTNSDSAGMMIFWVNPDFTHRMTFTKTGYEVVQEDISPSSASIYTVFMSGSGGASYIDTNWTTKELPVFAYSILPSENFLNNGTAYNFRFVISSDSSLTATMKLYDENNNLIGDETNTGTSINLLALINTFENSTIRGTYTISDGNTTYTYSKSWSVGDYSPGDYSLYAWLIEWNTQAVDSVIIKWIQVVIVFLTLIGVFYGLYTSTGGDSMDSAMSGMMGATMVLWIFSYTNWLYISYFPFEWLNKYGMAMIGTLLTGMFSLWRFTER